MAFNGCTLSLVDQVRFGHGEKYRVVCVIGYKAACINVALKPYHHTFLASEEQFNLCFVYGKRNKTIGYLVVAN